MAFFSDQELEKFRKPLCTKLQKGAWVTDKYFATISAQQCRTVRDKSGDKRGALENDEPETNPSKADFWPFLAFLASV